MNKHQLISQRGGKKTSSAKTKACQESLAKAREVLKDRREEAARQAKV